MKTLTSLPLPSSSSSPSDNGNTYTTTTTNASQRRFRRMTNKFTTTMVTRTNHVIYNFGNMIKFFGDLTHSDITLHIKMPRELSNSSSSLSASSSTSSLSSASRKISRSNSCISMIMDNGDDDDDDDENNDNDDSNDEDMDIHQSRTTFPPYRNLSITPYRKVDEIKYLHKVILASNSEYFSRLFKELDNNGGGGVVGIPLSIDVIIDFLGRDEDFIKRLIHEFFRLFYVNVIDDNSFVNYDFVYEHLLSMHKLALYFGFNSLLIYTEQKLISKLDTSFFPILCDFCITTTTVASTTSLNPVPLKQRLKNSTTTTTQPLSIQYYVKNENSLLFRRMMEWLEYCHDKEKCCFNHNHLVSRSSFFAATTTTTTTMLLTTKDAIKAVFIKNIKDFDQFDLNPQSYCYNALEHSFSIQNYARICTRCVCDSTRNEWPIVRGFYVIPLHCINYGDKSLQFRLKICQSSGIVCQLDVQKEYQSQNPSSSASIPPPPNHRDNIKPHQFNGIHTNQLSLFTKTESGLVYHESVNAHTSNRPIIDFALPQENDCFTSKCHKCLTSLHPTFIIKYNITIFDHDFQ